MLVRSLKALLSLQLMLTSEFLVWLVQLFKDHFRVVKPIKPKASRDKSAETFLVGLGLKQADKRS